MDIRAAAIADAPAIARVHVDSWRTTYKGIVPNDHLANLSYEERESMWRGVIENEAAPQRVFIAEDNGGVIGFAACGPERTHNPTYTGELYAIYLFQQHQRRGIGRELTRAVADYLLEQGHSGMLVWVLEQNPSRRFYEALGGEEVERKTIPIGGVNLSEVAYGWRDIYRLL
jgi:GNAT superfamily N-acetyltransferase